MGKHWSVWFGVVVVGACSNGESRAQSAAAVDSSSCTIAQTSQPLPEEVRETSGLAASRSHEGVLWTHNDSGGEPEIYAVGTDGTLRGRIRVTGVRLTDWEDIETGECEGGACLYIADIGDNAGRRTHVSIYELKEPDPSATEVAAVRTIDVKYSDGPQDAEALFRLPSGELFIVSKGGQGAIKLYRYSAVGAGGQGTMLLVRELSPPPKSERDRVTAASASPNGKWVAVRTYATLHLYRTEDLLAAGTPVTTYSLTALQERQGESVTLNDDGTLWLTSEAENPKDRPTFARITCVLP